MLNVLIPSREAIKLRLQPEVQAVRIAIAPEITEILSCDKYEVVFRINERAIVDGRPNTRRHAGRRVAAAAIPVIICQMKHHQATTTLGVKSVQCGDLRSQVDAP